MVAYAPERETTGTRHQFLLAALLAVAAVGTLYLGGETQQRVARLFQSTVLRPFIWTQETLAHARVRADQIERLQSEVDSLTAAVSTQAALTEENRSLRELLGLAERATPTWVTATVIRPGTPGSEGLFFVDVGYEDGVEPYAPIVSAQGLVGRIREARAGDAIGMDWTNPDFRVSAMLEDGSAYGMVENVRLEFREEDRLVLNGTAYHENLPRGARVITSGLGGVFPRGIPIGLIEETAEVQGTWRKSYWMRPFVAPGAVTHVLVARSAAPPDVTALWQADSTDAAGDSLSPGDSVSPGDGRAAPAEQPADSGGDPGGPEARPTDRDVESAEPGSGAVPPPTGAPPR